MQEAKTTPAAAAATTNTTSCWETKCALCDQGFAHLGHLAQPCKSCQSWGVGSPNARNFGGNFGILLASLGGKIARRLLILQSCNLGGMRTWGGGAEGAGGYILQSCHLAPFEKFMEFRGF